MAIRNVLVELLPVHSENAPKAVKGLDGSALTCSC